MKRIPISTALIVVGLCAVWISFGSRILPAARAHDYLNLYTGAALARDGKFAELHQPEVQLARERQLIPSLSALVPFVRPGFYAAILSPMSWLPYKTAFDVWIVTQCILLAGCWFWAWRRFGPDALVFSALALPGPLGIASGQDCVVILVVFIAAFELARREHPLASGVMLALMLIKFHLVLLWPIVLLLQRKWRMLAGYGAMAAVEFIVCVALGGWGAMLSYAALLTNKSLDRLSPSPELMISYQGLLSNLGWESPFAGAIVIGMVMLAFLWSIRGAPLWRMFTITALASEIVVPHVYGYDATLLLLPCWLTIFNSKQPVSKIAATLMATPIPFALALADRPWAAVSSVSMILFFAIVALERICEDQALKNRLAAIANPVITTIRRTAVRPIFRATPAPK